MATKNIYHENYAKINTLIAYVLSYPSARYPEYWNGFIEIVRVW
jgi:hypothetical protein